MRTETDFLGEMQLEDDWLFGIHTRRAAHNFAFSGERLRPDIFAALIEVKKAAAVANFKAGLLARLTGAPVRAGFQKGLGLGLLNRPVRYAPAANALENLNRVLARAGAPAAAHLELYLRPETEAAGREKLSRAGWKGEPLIGLHPGSSREWPAKRWPANYWARLSSAIEKRGWRPLFLGDRAAAAETDRILAQTGTRALTLAGRTNLEELSALIKLCRAFVSNDSGPLFLAAAAGIRTIGLYGPTAGKRHAPPGVTVLEAGLECQPCYRRDCPRPRCLESIPPEAVLRRLSEPATAVSR